MFRDKDGIPKYYNQLEITVHYRRKCGRGTTPSPKTYYLPNIRFSHAKGNKKNQITINWFKYPVTIKLLKSESEKHSNKRYEKERKKQIKKANQQLKAFNTKPFVQTKNPDGFHYDKETGIITRSAPMIKTVENGYEQIHYRSRKVPTHRLLFEILKINIRGYDIHHVDLNKRNNKFNNLQILKRAEHMKLHNDMRNKQRYGF